MSSDDRLTPSAWRDADGALVAVLAVTALALAARLVGLGSRVAHWDEARVGYWILRYPEIGSWSYRPIIHGPFLQQVNPVVFDLLGASDFTMRLVVALLGGLLPLSAWLFREHLRDSEMVALALLLAANPVLLYYSRFMRGDLPLAAFALFAIGFFVRTHDTREPKYLYAGTAMLALAFTTKENVLIYVVTWLGAAALLLDHRLFRAADRDAAFDDVFKAHLARLSGAAWRWKVPLALAFVEFFIIVVFFYAPRPDLWQALGNPARLPSVIVAATMGSWTEFFSTWVSGGHQSHEYLPYLKHYLSVLGFAAAPLVVFAGIGFVVDRYGGDDPRDLVSFASYWGFVSILGYPIVTDIKAPWATVHAVAPLAIPAAVGLALVYRWGKEAWNEDDQVGVALIGVVLLLVGAQVGATAVSTAYESPQSETNDLVQYGQPADGIRPTLDVVETAVAENEGVDVLYYGYADGDNEIFYVANESQNDRPPAADGWYERLPLAWYTELYGANVSSTDSAETLGQRVQRSEPPVVVARAKHEDEVAPHLDGYVALEHELTVTGSETILFVDERYVEASATGQ